MSLAVLIVALTVTAMITSMMRGQIDRDKGAALAAVGRSVTVALGENIRDRIQQIEQLAGAEEVWDAGLESEKVHLALQRMKRLRPVPAWAGVATPQGRVTAATDGLLVNRQVDSRPWFQAGLHGLYVSDVHPAQLLASLLPPGPAGEPLRFIDFAAPIKKEGRTVGVAALHADLQALDAIAATFLPDSASARHVEIYVFTRVGERLYGPDRSATVDFEQLASLVEALPPLQPGEQARPAVEMFWGDGERYLTTSWSLDEFTPGVGLGWRVLVRQPVGIAYAPAKLATRRALVGALFAALVATGFGLLLGRKFTLPIQQIAAAARDVERGQPVRFTDAFNQTTELRQLSSALESMTGRLEGMVQERTEQLKTANEELRALGEQQAAMLDNEMVGIILQDMVTRTAIWSNRAIARMFGYATEELLQHRARMLYPDDASFLQVGQEIRAAFSEGKDYITKLELQRKDGTPIWVHLQGSLLKEGKDRALWMMTDVTAQHQYQAQVEHIAFHDALTGLPNRLLLADRAAQAVANALRMGHLAAVAYLDLDGFKAVNDAHGHEAGDHLLKEIARRIEAVVRAGDTVARMGGDEFVLVLCGLSDVGDCNYVMQRLLQDVARPVQLPGPCDVQVSASIGVAFCPTDSDNHRDLVAAADSAMYAAKRAGKRGVAYASHTTPHDAGADRLPEEGAGF